MATQDLGFNVFALDKASRTFSQIADRVDKLSDELKELDRQRASPEIDIDADSAAAKGRQAAAAFGSGAEDEGRRRKGAFFRSLFRPNASILRTLRTGIPAAMSSPISAAALALGGVFAASFAGAVVSSGVFAAVGAGFAGLAAVALKQNARIQDSFEALATTVQGQLSQAAQPLVPVFDDALTTIRKMFGRVIREPLEDIFAGLGPAITPAVESAMRTVGNILDSLSTPELLEGMRTVLASFSAELPRIGDAVGDVFLDLAGNADNTAEAVENIVSVMSGLIRASGKVLTTLTDIFNLLSEMGRAMGPLVQGVRDFDAALSEVGAGHEDVSALPQRFVEQLREGRQPADALSMAVSRVVTEQYRSEAAAKAAGRAMESTSSASEMLRANQDKLRSQLESTNERLDEGRERLDRLKESLFGAADMTLNLRDAKRAYEEQLDSTTETIARNGRTLDVNTEAGRANQESIDGMAAAAHDQIQAMIEQGKSTQQVTEFTRQARQDFIEAADAAGLEAQEARNLADRLGLVPSEVQTKADLIDEASAKIQRLEERIAQLEREIGITATLRVQTVGEAATAFGGGVFAHEGGVITTQGVRRMHSGGTLRPDERVVIGQTGERILSREQNQAFEAGAGMAGDGATAGGGRPAINVENFHAAPNMDVGELAERFWFLTKARG